MATQLSYEDQRASAVEGMVAYLDIPTTILSKTVTFTSTILGDANGLLNRDKVIKPGTVVGTPYANLSIPNGLNPSIPCEPLYRPNETQSPVNILGIVTNQPSERSVFSVTDELGNVSGKTIGVLEQGYIWLKPETDIVAYTPVWVRYRVTGSVVNLGAIRNTRVANETLKTYNIVPLLHSIAGELNLFRITPFKQNDLLRDVDNVIPEPSETSISVED